jgi:hypothetical protein
MWSLPAGGACREGSSFFSGQDLGQEGLQLDMAARADQADTYAQTGLRHRGRGEPGWQSTLAFKSGWLSGSTPHMRHISANDMGWEEFDGKYINYQQFKKEWWAWRRMYHGMAGGALVTKSFKVKCISVDVKLMIEDLF